MIAVISGFKFLGQPVVKKEHLQDLEAPAHDDLYTRTNTGIVIGYGIRHVVEAIEASQNPAAPK